MMDLMDGKVTADDDTRIFSTEMNRDYAVNIERDSYQAAGGRSWSFMPEAHIGGRRFRVSICFDAEGKPETLHMKLIMEDEPAGTSFENEMKRKAEHDEWLWENCGLEGGGTFAWGTVESRYEHRYSASYIRISCKERGAEEFKRCLLRVSEEDKRALAARAPAGRMRKRRGR